MNKNTGILIILRKFTPSCFRTISITVNSVTPKRILEWKIIGRRIRERQRKRWIGDIEDDIQITEIRGWRKLYKEREEWKRVTEKAKTHSGL
jgi:hypothetical protein